MLYFSLFLQVEKPEATLSQERRGTVSFPTFPQSFLDTYEKNNKEFDFPYGVRNFLIVD